MTKQEFTDAVHAQAASSGIEMTKKDLTAVIEVIFWTLAKEVAIEGRQAIAGFGTFKKTHRKAREGRNPRNGEPMTIPASSSVSFKPAPKLKDLVNDSAKRSNVARSTWAIQADAG